MKHFLSRVHARYDRLVNFIVSFIDYSICFCVSDTFEERNQKKENKNKNKNKNITTNYIDLMNGKILEQLTEKTF